MTKKFILYFDFILHVYVNREKWILSKIVPEKYGKPDFVIFDFILVCRVGGRLMASYSGMLLNKWNALNFKLVALNSKIPSERPSLLISFSQI